MKVVKHLLKWIVEGKEIHYLTGNHDEMLRKFKDFELGKFKISNKIVLEMDGKKAWFFHGDVFDVTMQYSKWLTRLGGIGYDFLILLNSFINFVLFKFGRNKLSLSKTIKNSVKGAVKYINRFEKTAVEIAIANGFSYVVCGHIHHPNIKEYKVGDQIVTYLNSGDWIENLTALEYKKGEWSIYKYENNFFEEDLHIEMDKSNKELFNEMLDEFKMMNNQ